MSQGLGVQVVENWAHLVGRISAIHDSVPGGSATIQLDVAEANPVATFPNLYEWATGKIVDLQIPVEKLRALRFSPGDRISCRVRLVGPNHGLVQIAERLDA